MRDTSDMERNVARILGCPPGWVAAAPADRDQGVVLSFIVTPPHDSGGRHVVGVRYRVEATNRAMVGWGVTHALDRACAMVRGELELDGHLHAVRCTRDEQDAILSALAVSRAADRFSVQPPTGDWPDEVAERRRKIIAMTDGALVRMMRDLGQSCEAADDGTALELAEELTQLAGHALAMAICARKEAARG